MAVVTTICLAIIFQTQNVVSRLNGLGGEIGLSERLSMTGYDLIHLGSLYGIFITAALLIAFIAGAILFRLVKSGRSIIYMFAGATAMVVMLFAMKKVFFDVHLIAGARDALGIGLQMLAGAIGGLVFARISRARPTDYRA